jgi:cytochrome c-type biogenesis protein CcmH
VSLFWVNAALLIAAALIFVLPPLLGRRAESGPTRDEVSRVLYRQRLLELERDVDSDVLTRAQYDRARLELEREFLAESPQAANDSAARPPSARTPWAAWLVGLAMPAMAVGLYVQFGADAANPQAQPDATAEQAQPSIQELAGILAKQLAKNPEDRTGWLMMARLNILLNRYAQAAQAYALADGLAALDDPRLLAAYAQSLALANDQQYAGRPTELIKRALKIAPRSKESLWLAGWAAFQRKDYLQAVGYWQRLEGLIPAGREVPFEGLREQLAQARRLAGQPGSPVPTQAAVAGAGADARADAGAAVPASLQVAVQLAPEVKDRVSPEDTVFVYAQALTGPRVPLALARLTASRLPLQITLDDTMAMAPAFKLSSQEQVTVTARVSKTGNAMPESGDLLGESEAVSTRQQDPVSIAIDKVLP